MFGRKPFEGLDAKVIESEARPHFKAAFQRATIHFGEGRMNPATIACIFAMVEEQLTGKPLMANSGSTVSRLFTSAIFRG
jgi:hypothetical protein